MELNQLNHESEFLPWPEIAPARKEGFSGTLLVRRLIDDPDQWYFLYLPRCDWKDAPIFISVHGITRNAYEHAMLFAPFAERHGVVLIAPLFTRERHRRYQRLGRERKAARADIVLENIIADTCVLTRGSGEKIHLFGYSGGGQFVHRYAFAHPERVTAIAIGAAGWYTFPDGAMEYPLGLASAAFEFEPAKFLNIPATVLVGEKDTGATMRSIPRTLLTRTRAKPGLSAVAVGSKRCARPPRFIDMTPASIFKPCPGRTILFCAAFAAVFGPAECSSRWV